MNRPRDHRPGGVVDPDDLQLDAVHQEGQLAEHRAGDEGAVRGAAPVAVAVRGGDAHRDGGQAGVGDVAHHQVLGLDPGLHVGSQPAGGDHIVFEYDMSGTFDGSPFVCDGVDVIAVADGLVTRKDTYLDYIKLTEQIGEMPPIVAVV